MNYNTMNYGCIVLMINEISTETLISGLKLLIPDAVVETLAVAKAQPVIL